MDALTRNTAAREPHSMGRVTSANVGRAPCARRYLQGMTTSDPDVNSGRLSISTVCPD